MELRAFVVSLSRQLFESFDMLRSFVGKNRSTMRPRFVCITAISSPVSGVLFSLIANEFSF